MQQFAKVFLIVVAAASQAACVYVSTDGDSDFDGDVVTRTSEPDAFDQLAIVGGFRSVEVEICADCEPRVSIRGDERLVEEVSIEVDDGVLEIGQDRQWVISTERPQIRVKTTSLEAVTLTSSADLTVSGISSNTFEVVNTGSGDMELTGSTGVLDLTVTGSGKVSAFDLFAETVQLTSSGSGDVEVCADGFIEATLTGSGDLFYDCQPEDTDFNTTGSGDVSIR